MREIQGLYRIFNECRSISTDSRKLIPGSIFFSLKGRNFNGNDYAVEAIEKGCLYAVVDDPSLPRHDRIFHVPDALDALQKLAIHHRRQLKIPFIGITGSNGKTTTKELIAAVLGRKYRVCATQGNLNNHIGVPLTVLSVDDHDFAIIEMGANHIGEIAALCKIADPDYGIITNIGKAHLDGFGSPLGVIQAKSELYEHLARRKSTAFINAEDCMLMKLARERNLQSVLYGIDPGSACSGKISSNQNLLKINILFAGKNTELEAQTSLVGDYNLNNLLAAACIGDYFNVSQDEIAASLSEYQPSNSRSQLLSTTYNKIILDAYNANPSSMEGSVRNFLSLKEGLPKMIILGDMLELGKYSNQEHRAIIELLKNESFANVFFVGPEFCTFAKSLSINCFRNVEELIEHFRSNPVINYCILLKGSRGIRLERLLEVL